MPRKTSQGRGNDATDHRASMRPRPDAAENFVSAGALDEPAQPLQ